jgi:hypothetical protein
MGFCEERNLLCRLTAEAVEKVEAAREREAASLAKEREADARATAAAAAEERARAETAAVQQAAEAAEQNAKEAKKAGFHVHVLGCFSLSLRIHQCFVFCLGNPHEDSGRLHKVLTKTTFWRARLTCNTR